MDQEGNAAAAKNDMGRLQRAGEGRNDNQLRVNALHRRLAYGDTLVDALVGQAGVHVPPGSLGGKGARGVVAVGMVGFVVGALGMTDEVDCLAAVGQEQRKAVFWNVRKCSFVVTKIWKDRGVIVAHDGLLMLPLV